MRKNRWAGRDGANARGAFTLIEILVVVVIIAILAGIILRTTVYVNNKLGRARATEQLHQIKNALVEYHSSYGIFPPVNKTILPPGHDTMNWEFPFAGPPVSSPDFNTGLVYYLCNTNDPYRARWEQFLEGIMPQIWHPPRSNYQGSGWNYFTNQAWYCLDPWENSYRYECYAPYQSFRLWSAGPDKTDGTKDDIGVTWEE
jgi:prepilin-type N-terminal cleavage/methylation domain-containing protein